MYSIYSFYQVTIYVKWLFTSKLIVNILIELVCSNLAVVLSGTFELPINNAFKLVAKLGKRKISWL